MFTLPRRASSKRARKVKAASRRVGWGLKKSPRVRVSVFFKRLRITRICPIRVKAGLVRVLTTGFEGVETFASNLVMARERSAGPIPDRGLIPANARATAS